MSVGVDQLVNVSDFRKLQEGPPFYQLINGRLLVSPSPNRYHQDICQNLLVILRNYLDKHPVGVVYHSPSDVYLTSYDAYQPDLYFVSNANAAILTPQGAAGAPDLIVEVLSAGTEHFDRELKRKVYAQAGVKELWLIDPDAKEIQIHQLNPKSKRSVVSHGSQARFRSALLPGLVVRAENVFQPSRLG